MRSVKVGNAAIDGEVIGQGWKMALEIKSSKHDVIRGIGQSAALVTSVQRAKRIKPEVFHEHLVLLGIDAKGMVHQVYP